MQCKADVTQASSVPGSGMDPVAQQPARQQGHNCFHAVGREYSLRDRLTHRVNNHTHHSVCIPELGDPRSYRKVLLAPSSSLCATQTW